MAACQSGIGDVGVQMPKVRDRSGSGIRFNSTLLPPYLKRAKRLDELISWLDLRGVALSAPISLGAINPRERPNIPPKDDLFVR
jgi:hypothetical protein